MAAAGTAPFTTAVSPSGVLDPSLLTGASPVTADQGVTALPNATAAMNDPMASAMDKLLAELQALAGPLSLYGEARGQLASKNLDSSEKMELGGAYGVRAYPEGEAYGDQGYILTLEARLRLAALSRRTLGEWQAAVFVDNGSVTLNRSAWAPGPNRRTLSAAGVGLTWANPRSFVVKVSYAVKLGDQPALSAPDRSGRLWVQLSKFF